jgi:hypothetical protein
VTKRQSQANSQPGANDTRVERLREHTIISVLIANYLQNERILDPTNSAQQLGPVIIETLIDGDIPVRIEVQKQSSGPAWIEWLLWPHEPGRQTRGGASLRRLSVTNPLLGEGPYGRWRKRSERLGRIALPVAKWGLKSPQLLRFAITTTY